LKKPFSFNSFEKAVPIQSFEKAVPIQLIRKSRFHSTHSKKPSPANPAEKALVIQSI
jgi:hypothetical protein